LGTIRGQASSIAGPWASLSTKIAHQQMAAEQLHGVKNAADIRPDKSLTAILEEVRHFQKTMQGKKLKGAGREIQAYQTLMLSLWGAQHNKDFNPLQTFGRFIDDVLGEVGQTMYGDFEEAFDFSGMKTSVAHANVTDMVNCFGGRRGTGRQKLFSFTSEGPIKFKFEAGKAHGKSMGEFSGRLDMKVSATVYVHP